MPANRPTESINALPVQETSREETKKPSEVVSFEGKSQELRLNILKDLKEKGINLPEELNKREDSWVNKEFSNWTREDIQNFERSYLYIDDERIRIQTSQEIKTGIEKQKLSKEELAKEETPPTKPPDGFPNRAEVLSDVLQRLDEVMYGMDQYGNGIVNLEMTPEQLKSVLSDTDFEVDDKALEYLAKILPKATMCGNTTGNSLVVGTRVYKETVEWAQMLRKIEELSDERQRLEASRIIANELREALVPLGKDEMGELKSKKRAVIGSPSGTHLWYLLSQGLVSQATEAGRTVLNAANEENLGYDVGGQPIGKEKSKYIRDREIVQTPVRHENAEPLTYEEFKQLHWNAVVNEMSMTLERVAKRDAQESGAIFYEEKPFFSHSFVVPGKGGALYTEMAEFLKTLSREELENNEFFGVEQRKTIQEFYDKGGRFEVILDCAQGRWLSANEALDILDEAGIDGWYMATTSKAAEGAAFGGIAVGTEGAVNKLKENLKRGDIYDTKLLANYFGLGYLPEEVEEVLFARIQLDNIFDTVDALLNEPIEDSELEQAGVDNPDYVVRTYKILLSKHSYLLNLFDEKELEEMGQQDPVELLLRALVNKKIDEGKVRDIVRILSPKQQYLLAIFLNNPNRNIETEIDDEDTGNILLSAHTALMARMLGAMETYREIHETENRIEYTQAANFLMEAAMSAAAVDENLNGNIEFQDFSDNPEFESSSIVTFKLSLHGKPMSAQQLTRLRMLLRIGVDVDKDGNVINNAHPIHTGNPFGEKVSARVSESDETYTDAEGNTHAKYDIETTGTAQVAQLRLGMGAELLKETALLLAENAQDLENPSEELIMKMAVIEQVFKGNMRRIGRLLANWERLETTYYDDEK